jgi:DNA repair exonuclease SbcCD ATPase subunit
MTSIIQLPQPKSKIVETIFHLADLHCRIGQTKEESRFNEYFNVFENLLFSIKSHQSTQNNSAIAIIAGDLFHHKTRLDAFSIKLFNKLIDDISELMPLFLIKGNHDMNALIDDPQLSDLIDCVLNIKDNKERPNVCYMKETGHYVCSDIGFGLVSVSDTLVPGTSSGKQVDQLPIFPQPELFPDYVKTKFGLFHGTITNSSLQNGTSAAHGISLSWFSGYDALILGDCHFQQIHNVDSKGNWNEHMPWGFPGSLCQQNFGEEIINHGYFEWSVKKRKLNAVNIYNEIGMVKLKFINSSKGKLVTHRTGWNVIRSPKYTLLSDMISDPLFPKILKIRIYKTYDEDTLTNVNELKKILNEANKTYDIQIMNQEFEYIDDVKTEEVISAKLTDMNSTSNYISFIEQNSETSIQYHKDWKEWIKNPQTLILEIDQNIPLSLHQKVGKKNLELNKYIQDHQVLTEGITVKSNSFKITYIEWDWILCFNENCWFNFENMNGFTSIISGTNGTGKTCFLECLVIAIYGHSTPAKMSDSHSSSIIHRNIPQGVRARTMINIEYNGEIYCIKREFKINSKVPDKIKEQEITISSIALSQTLSGSKTTSDWIKKHLGSIEEFTQNTLLTQFDSKDFFCLPEQDQISKIEASQNIDVVNNIDNVLSQAIKMYTVVNTSIDDIYNHSLVQSNSFNEDIYKNNIDQINITEEEIIKTKLGISAIACYEEWKHISQADFEANYIDKISTYNEQINNVQVFKTYEELYIEKGIVQSSIDSICLEDNSIKISETESNDNMEDIEFELKELNSKHPLKPSKTYDQYLEWSSIYSNFNEKDIQQSKAPETSLKTAEDSLLELLTETEALQKVKYTFHQNVDISKKYISDFKSMKKKRKDTQLIIDDESIKIVNLKKNKKIIRVKIIEISNISEPKNNQKEVEDNYNKIHVLIGNKDKTLKKVKKLNKFIDLYLKLKEDYEEVQLEIQEVQKKIQEIRKYEHPYNPNCKECQKQLWNINLKEYESYLNDKESKELNLKSKIDKHIDGKSVEDLNVQLSDSNAIIALIEKTDVDDLKNQCLQWNQYISTEAKRNEYTNEINNLYDKITASERIITASTDYIKNMDIILDDVELLNEHMNIISNHTRWNEVNTKAKKIIVSWKEYDSTLKYREYKENLKFWENEIKTIEVFQNWTQETHKLKYKYNICSLKTSYLKMKSIDCMITVLEKKNVLQAKLEYWKSVQTLKPKWSKFQTLNAKLTNLDDNLNKLKQINLNLGKEKIEFDISTNLSHYLEDLKLRIITLHHISISFKEYRQYVFNTLIIPQILKHVNTIISHVAENNTLELICKMESVNATTNSKTKIKDVIKWSFSCDGSNLPIEKASGFQRFMFGLSLRVALTRINTHIRNKQLFIDEGFTTFDSIHLSKVNEMLDSLKTSYTNIIIVSHLEAIKENIPNKILIERNNGSSTIQFGCKIQKKQNK